MEKRSQNFNKSGYLDCFQDYLMRPVDASSLGAFRFLFGLVMVWSTIRYYYHGWIDSYYIKRKFIFTYEWFPWISLWPDDGIYYHYALMGISALFLAFGLFYRFSAIIFFVTYAYTFLLGKSLYNNHYYFICLLGLLFCCVNANRWMSLDSLWKSKFCNKSLPETVPYWNVLIIKLQIFIVYFYGGIAKFNMDWLRGEPLRLWFSEVAGREDTPSIVAGFLESEFAAYFFSYGGLIFDLAIGFLLIYKKTRLLAFGLILVFNITNNWLFSIGIFPVLMIAATVIFLEPESPKILIQKYFPQITQKKVPSEPHPSPYGRAAMIFVSIYLLIQFLLPFRHWLYKGNVSWTEEGRFFSWHMKTRDKHDCKVLFLATLTETKETWKIPAKKYLTKRQYINMCKHPQMVLQYAHYLGKKLKEANILDVIVTSRSMVSLNGRPPQPMIDPDVNLLKKNYSAFRHADWILPLKE